MAMNPLHQFKVEALTPLNVAGIDVSFTNHSLWLVMATAIVALIFMAGASRRSLVPGRLQAFVEMSYEFIETLTRDTAGKAALKFAPLIMTLFLFISAANLIGMFPTSFTATAQVFTTATLALAVFFLVIVVGFAMHGLKFLGLFYPKGTPIYLAPLIIPLEVISFFARPATLALRLAANMIAGHILLKIFATFIIMLGSWAVLSAVAPLVVLIAITALEVFVALLQAYIFTVLTVVYLNDALHLH